MSSNKFNPLKDTFNQKSIFEHITNNIMYVNKSMCFDDTPMFIAHNIVQNIDVENELKGLNKINTKCDVYKHIPPKEMLKNPQNQKVCDKNNKIRPL
jgi:hypothetical protein